MSSSRHGVAKIFVEQTSKVPLTAYKLHMGEYPTTEEGIHALVKAPNGKNEIWKGPYLEVIPLDPWGNPYEYRYPSTKENVDYQIFSLGRDGIESRDDIANWKSNQEPTPPLILLIFALAFIVILAAIWRKFRTSRSRTTR